MRQRGFTLLEMMVASLLMGIAVVGLLSAISGSMRNASRLTSYDRATIAARSQMDQLLLDFHLPRNTELAGPLDPVSLGGATGGWRAVVHPAEVPPNLYPGVRALDRVDLEIWWEEGGRRRSFRLEGYRTNVVTPEEASWLMQQRALRRVGQ